MSCRLVDRRNFVFLLPSHASLQEQNISLLCVALCWIKGCWSFSTTHPTFVHSTMKSSSPLCLVLYHPSCSMVFFFAFESSSSNCLSKPFWNFDTRAAAGSDARGSGTYRILSCRPLVQFSIAFSRGFFRVPDDGRGHVSAMQCATSFTLMCCKLPIILFIVCFSKWFRKLIAFCCNVDSVIGLHASLFCETDTNEAPLVFFFHTQPS